LRRILLVLGAALFMVTVMAAVAFPALAKERACEDIVCAFIPFESKKECQEFYKEQGFNPPKDTCNEFKDEGTPA
jgi:hypothetical protein